MKALVWCPPAFALSVPWPEENQFCCKPLDSDIDLLVEFEPGQEPGLLGLAAMEAELGELLGGKKVDLRTPRDLSRHFRDQVLQAAKVQYAE